jgi:hypothetical protein
VTVAGAGGSLTNAVVRGCTVTGMRDYFTISEGFGGNHVENCTVEDCTRGMYFEPDPRIDSLGPVLIQSNRFVRVNVGVAMLMYPGRQFDSLTCLGNEIVLAQHAGWGFFNCDVCLAGPSGSMTNVTFLNNIIRYGDWAPRPNSVEGGFFYTNMRNMVFGNNVIALGTVNALRVRQCPAGFIPPVEPHHLCDGVPGPVSQEPSYPPCLEPLLPGYRRAWFHNRDLSGSLLDVRLSNGGVDGLSVQQQWP